MSEIKETDNKPAAGRKTMSLNVKRTVEQGHIRQNFSHGRSKSVLVETKRKRNLPGSSLEEPVQKPEPAIQQKPEPRAFQKAQPEQDKRQQKVLRQLSAGEVDARAKALVEARKREDVERREREIEDARLLEENKIREIEDRKRQTEEEAERKAAEENERNKAAEEAKTKPQAAVQAVAAAPAERPAPAVAPRKVGPDSFRALGRPQDERRPQGAGLSATMPVLAALRRETQEMARPGTVSGPKDGRAFVPKVAGPAVRRAQAGQREHPRVPDLVQGLEALERAVPVQPRPLCLIFPDAPSASATTWW
jgi:translation initiation factor IF-2